MFTKWDGVELLLLLILKEVVKTLKDFHLYKHERTLLSHREICSQKKVCVYMLLSEMKKQWNPSGTIQEKLDEG